MQQFDKFLGGGRECFVPFMHDSQRPKPVDVLQFHAAQQAGVDFPFESRFGENRHPGTDFHSPFDVLRIIELMDDIDRNFRILQPAIQFSSNSQFRCESDVIFSVQFCDVDALFSGQPMFRRNNENQLLFLPGDAADFAPLFGKRDDAQIRLVVEQTGIDFVGMQVLDLQPRLRVEFLVAENIRTRPTTLSCT